MVQSFAKVVLLWHSCNYPHSVQKKDYFYLNTTYAVKQMAEKSSATTFETVMRDLKARKYYPIYILMGDESYYIDKVSDYIEENVLEPDDTFFNQVVLFGSDTNAVQIVDLAKSYPVMPAQHRVVIVKEAQNLRTFDAIDKYLEHPVNTTLLVLCYKNGSIDRRKKIVAKANAVGVVMESKKKRETELPSFIEKYLRSQHVAIDDKSTALIAESIGADLNRLISELDKLIISLPDNDRRITPELVEKQIGVSKDFNAFELRRAIIDRDVFAANRIVNYFDKNPKAGSLYSILPMLFSYFQNLMVAFYTPNRSSDNAVAAALDLKSPWAARDYMAGMRQYSATKTLQIISKIREIDAKSKGLDNVNTSSGDLMRELIFFIMH